MMVGLDTREVKGQCYRHSFLNRTLSMLLLTGWSFTRADDGTISRLGLRIGREFRFGERRVLIHAVSAIVARLHDFQISVNGLVILAIIGNESRVHPFSGDGRAAKSWSDL
jgi:hypothetical protein